ncbi:MAG TPA: GNAT family N-acetyltransferase [Myxococcota bacterium]|nr:GNAT family N-acetyltransferase [Myxococcota bacterium]
MSWRIRKLRRDDVAATAGLLARAFADNPAYAFMHPRVATRPRVLRRFFERNLIWHLPVDLTWVVVDGAAPVGTATLEPPGGIQGSAWKLITHWLLPTLLEQGPKALRRMLEADRAFARLNRSNAEAPAYWHLHAVAVEPKRQRSGAGSALLGHVFGELERLLPARPAPVVLSTQRESNVRLYGRYGFEERGTFTIGAGTPDAFTSWCMRRR